MHIHALDSYIARASPVHRLDPRVKLVLVFLLILTASLTPDRAWVALGALQLLLLAVTLGSRVGVGRVQKRSAVALPFTLAALTIAFSTPGRVVVALPGAAWGVTDAGLVRFLSIVFRSYLSIQAAVILAASTRFPDMLWALRALRVPRVLVAIGGFLYRYVFVLADEAQRLMRARLARSTEPEGRGGRSVAWRARVTGGMAGSLFIRSYERGERIYAAMVARGYDGEVRTMAAPRLRSVDLLLGLLGACTLALILVLGQAV